MNVHDDEPKPGLANYEQATRAPLILAAPGKRGGEHTRALVELVDLYPTLYKLAGAPRPAHVQEERRLPAVRLPLRRHH